MHTPWQNILGKYSSGKRPLFIEGAGNQPEFSLTANLNYKGKNGQLKFVWFNSSISRIRVNFNIVRNAEDSFRKEKISAREYVYTGVTQIYFELPSDKYYFKVFQSGFLLNLISKINSQRIQTGDLNLDSNYIFLEKPAGIINPITSKIAAMSAFDLKKSMLLTSDYVDPVTAKPYLHLRINHLITEEEKLETLFQLCNDIITDLYRY